MFILLGMLAVAASDLLLLLERRNCGVSHEVHPHDGGSCVWVGRLHYTPLLIPLSFCDFYYLECSSDWTTDTLEYLNRHSCSVVRCSSISTQAEPSVAQKRDLVTLNAKIGSIRTKDAIAVAITTWDLGTEMRSPRTEKSGSS
jgi:hypothetical protein